ncbi:zinc finger MYM-type protein 4-like isoform X1 [Osmerus eperlanus]|uniref:zinc finger MYM-type protein 4-like isoform X1 n=1 Tax=Osmerus eperlanus TaxID=29151 RepID=UPI002E1619B2
MAGLEEFGRSEQMTRTFNEVMKPAGHHAVLSRSPSATQGDRRVSAFSSHTPSPHRLDGAVVNYPAGGDPQCHQVESPQRSDCGAIAIEAPTSPLIKIKDEPIDEDYDAALLPQSSSRQVKEELENQEDELRISSVYSVGGGPSYSAPSVAGPTTHTPSIFGPGRSLAPAPLVQPPLAPPPPGRGGSSANIRCSGCSKVLLKGQTAFQKKGSTQLFCSTVCLTGFLPPTVPARPCHQCLKEIENPMNVPSVVVDNNLKDFCSPVCLFAFNCQKKTDPAAPELPFCSICKKSNEVQHEVTYHGELHRLCSDDCFFTWRCNRNLAINFCENCGMYCSSKGGGCQNLTIGDVNMRFCSPTCISTYKQTCSKLMKCNHCGNEVMVSTMLVSNDPLGKVKLYCSSTCVSYSRPPQHILSGTPFPCTHCKVNAVPQYHLAMVDGSIRNFCSHDCVTTFRSEQSRAPLTAQMNGTSTNPLAPPQPDLPGTGSSPYGLSPLSSSRPVAPGYPDAPSQTSAAPCASTPGSSRPYEQPQQGLTPLSTSRFTGPITLDKSCSQEPSSRPELLHTESTETDAVAPHWDVKNEAIMCRPFTHNQETLCNLPTQTTHTPAGFSGCSFTTTINEEKVKVVLLPIPVPVFIPVPMNMYSQYMPVPMPMPIPVPVPVVLPSAPSGSQSKEPHDPLVQSQGIAEEVEEVEKDKPVSHGDQGSTYSGDLESEAISTPLSWEEESNPAPSSQRGRGPVAVDPPSTSEPGAMDLEADIPTERCDASERAVLRKQQRLAGRKRPREGFSPTERIDRQFYNCWIQVDTNKNPKRARVCEQQVADQAKALLTLREQMVAKKPATDISHINTAISIDAVELKKAELRNQLKRRSEEDPSPRAEVQLATDELIKTLEETRKALDDSQSTMEETWNALAELQEEASTENQEEASTENQEEASNEMQEEASTEMQEDNGMTIQPPPISPDDGDLRTEQCSPLVGRNVHPDIDIPVLTPDVEQLISKLSWGCSNQYSSLLFRLAVTEDKYNEWATNTDWDGSRGKWALPINLRQFMMDAVRNKFPTMNDKDGIHVKNGVNEYLRIPMKTGARAIHI